jgi:hypothetical protein
MNYPRGSMWGKWDLHVHTPASLVQGYGGDNDAVWEQFFTDPEALPPEYKVVGINDYIFLDGYRKVMDAKRSGRLSNLDLILPVVELRLDKFGGTASCLSRVNFHVIFSDEVDVEDIEQQFINMLLADYQLTPAYENLDRGEWRARATRESLADLGQRIIDSVPPSERPRFQAPLIEGFNNINFHFDEVLKLLDKHYFRDKFFTAVGKTEWWNIKWNDHSIADKKTVVNKADFVFVCAETIADCQKARQSLTESHVNSRLLDCSDAHHFSSATQKERIGNCNTWIKADSTFDGLRLALIEYDQRVFLGHVPDKLKTVQSNKSKYIRLYRK